VSLPQKNCKVWGLVHFSASKTLPLAKSVGRKHGPDPFRATLQFSWSLPSGGLPPRVLEFTAEGVSYVFDMTGPRPRHDNRCV